MGRQGEVVRKQKAFWDKPNPKSKSKKAILFASAMGNTIADKESYAYSHPEYLELLEVTLQFGYQEVTTEKNTKTKEELSSLTR